MRRRSIRFQLTVWYALALSASLALLGGLIWFSLRHELFNDIDAELQGRAARFEKYFRTESAIAAPEQIRDELEEFCQALPPLSYINLRSENGFAFHYPAGSAAASGNFRMLRQEFYFHDEMFDLEIGAPIGDALHALDLLRILLLSLIPV